MHWLNNNMIDTFDKRRYCFYNFIIPHSTLYVHYMNDFFQYFIELFENSVNPDQLASDEAN